MLTKEPVWIAVGVAIGAAIEWTFKRNNRYLFILSRPEVDLAVGNYVFLNSEISCISIVKLNFSSNELGS